jgi:hypothetical protein
MLKLADFFQPLNFITILEFIFLFFFFDVLGLFIYRKLFKFKDARENVVIRWLVGFGGFIFLWFLLSLFIPADRIQILVSIILLLAICLPGYIKEEGSSVFFQTIWRYRVPILIIAPFLPAIFVKASLPPYQWDEMAYHFSAPSALRDISPISYTGYLYADVPRILDSFWLMVFTLFHTYSIARLFHFTILVTSMAFSYAVLKKHFGILIGFLFVFIFFSIPQDIVFLSTSGYVDVGAYSFLLIGLMYSIDFLMSKSGNSIVLASIFWAMNLGTKYTGASAFVSFLLLFIVYVIWKRRDYKNSISRNALFLALLGFVFFGGYWYIKNFIFYGNPIFPFLIPCLWGHYATACPQASGFFGNWTIKITSANSYKILSLLFTNDLIMQFMVLLAPFIIFFGKTKKLLSLFLLSFLSVIGELLFLKHFSGFQIRYHQHMQLFLLFGVVLIFVNKYKNRIVSFLVKVLLGVVVLNAAFLYAKNIVYSDSLHLLNWNEINYAIGRMNIHQWTAFYFNKMNSTILWCENPPGGREVTIARFDPDVIWYSNEGLMRVFMTNCSYSNPPLQGVPIGKVLNTAKEQKIQFWISSLNKCVPDSEVSSNPDQTYLRRLNNILVCNSQEVIPYLYYFDYSKIKI